MGQEMSKPSSTTAINGSEQTYSTQEPSHPASALSSQKTSADVMDKFGANAGLAISMALNNNRRAISSDQSNKENSSCAIGILKKPMSKQIRQREEVLKGTVLNPRREMTFQRSIYEDSRSVDSCSEGNKRRKSEDFDDDMIEETTTALSTNINLLNKANPRSMAGTAHKPKNIESETKNEFYNGNAFLGESVTRFDATQIKTPLSQSPFHLRKVSSNLSTLSKYMEKATGGSKNDAIMEIEDLKVAEHLEFSVNSNLKRNNVKNNKPLVLIEKDENVTNIKNEQHTAYFGPNKSKIHLLPKKENVVTNPKSNLRDFKKPIPRTEAKKTSIPNRNKENSLSQFSSKSQISEEEPKATSCARELLTKERMKLQRTLKRVTMTGDPNINTSNKKEKPRADDSQVISVNNISDNDTTRRLSQISDTRLKASRRTSAISSKTNTAALREVDRGVSISNITQDTSVDQSHDRSAITKQSKKDALNNESIITVKGNASNSKNHIRKSSISAQLVSNTRTPNLKNVQSKISEFIQRDRELQKARKGAEDNDKEITISIKCNSTIQNIPVKLSEIEHIELDLGDAPLPIKDDGTSDLVIEKSFRSSSGITTTQHSLMNTNDQPSTLQSSDLMRSANFQTSFNEAPQINVDNSVSTAPIVKTKAESKGLYETKQRRVSNPREFASSSDTEPQSDEDMVYRTPVSVNAKSRKPQKHIQSNETPVISKPQKIALSRDPSQANLSVAAKTPTNARVTRATQQEEFAFKDQRSPSITSQQSAQMLQSTYHPHTNESFSHPPNVNPMAYSTMQPHPLQLQQQEYYLPQFNPKNSMFQSNLSTPKTMNSPTMHYNTHSMFASPTHAFTNSQPQYFGFQAPYPQIPQQGMMKNMPQPQYYQPQMQVQNPYPQCYGSPMMMMPSNGPYPSHRVMMSQGVVNMPQMQQRLPNHLPSNSVCSPNGFAQQNWNPMFPTPQSQRMVSSHYFGMGPFQSPSQQTSQTPFQGQPRNIQYVQQPQMQNMNQNSYNSSVSQRNTTYSSFDLGCQNSVQRTHNDIKDT